MKTRRLEKISELQTGDVIRHVVGNAAFVVTGTYGDFAIAVRTMHISNASEWLVIERDNDRTK